MNNKVDINEIINVKDKLKNMDTNDAVLVEEEGITRYAIIPIEAYELLEQINNMTLPQPGQNVVIAGDIEELTYEEYERIKSAVLETLEKSLKPKAEKLN